jgi:hypothetical protein
LKDALSNYTIWQKKLVELYMAGFFHEIKLKMKAENKTGLIGILIYLAILLLFLFCFIRIEHIT